MTVKRLIMSEILDTQDTTGITPTEGMAQSLLPFYIFSTDEANKKARYLSYLVAHFSVMESAKLAKVHLKTVKRWRADDSNFHEVEKQCTTELAKKLADELIDIEFTRNFRLIMAKDFQILFKDATGQTLTDKEQQYLMVIRKFYTPQQLAIIKQMIGGNGQQSEAFDFTKTVLEIRLSREEKHGGQR